MYIYAYYIKKDKSQVLQILQYGGQCPEKMCSKCLVKVIANDYAQLDESIYFFVGITKKGKGEGSNLQLFFLNYTIY